MLEAIWKFADQLGSQLAGTSAEFVDIAGGLRQQGLELDGEGLPEQRGERGGGDEVAGRADFVRAAGVVAEII